MKIAHIAPPWIAIPPENYGGTEIVISHLVEEQVTQRHEVTLFAPGDAKTSAKHIAFFAQSLLDAGIPWSAHLKAYYHFYRAVEYIKEHDFDIVHMHLSSAADMYLFPLTAQLRTPHVMTLHSCFPFDRVGSWTGDADKFYMEWAAAVPLVAISAAARNAVSSRLHVIDIVHHGLPMEHFCPAVEQPEDFFVWLGRIVPEKGTHLAIQAAKKSGVPLVLAGTIDRNVPESVNYFEQMIAPELDGQQIRYIGPVNMEQKIALLSRARGFLNPIEWEEPFGVVMIEAMAVGCPVISFARGAAPEIVVHGKNGFLVQNVDEMACGMGNIVPLNRANVRSSIEQHFSVRAMAEKYERIYKKVIRSHRLQQTTALVPDGCKPLMTSSPEKTSLFRPGSSLFR